jgi:hypothetical protein
LLREGTVVQEKTQACEVPALGDQRLAFTLDLPAKSGNYQVEATLIKAGADNVSSLRDFSIMTGEK